MNDTEELTTGTDGWAIRVTTDAGAMYPTPHGWTEELSEAPSLTRGYAATPAATITYGTIDLIATGRPADTGWAVHYTSPHTTGYIPEPTPPTGAPANTPVDDSPTAHTLAAAASMTREYAASVARGIAITNHHSVIVRLVPTGRPATLPHH